MVHVNFHFDYISILQAFMFGMTVIRPMYNVFPQDLIARDVSDQFFWGDSLMIAPVLAPGLVERDVYFADVNIYRIVLIRRMLINSQLAINVSIL